MAGGIFRVGRWDVGNTTNFRKERIEKLLYELRYEVERGMLEHDIDETIGFEFIVPLSRVIPNGVVHCQFSTRPIPHYQAVLRGVPTGLKLVKSDG